MSARRRIGALALVLAVLGLAGGADRAPAEVITDNPALERWAAASLMPLPPVPVYAQVAPCPFDGERLGCARTYPDHAEVYVAPAPPRAWREQHTDGATLGPRAVLYHELGHVVHRSTAMADPWEQPTGSGHEVIADVWALCASKPAATWARYAVRSPFTGPLRWVIRHQGRAEACAVFR